MELIISRKMHLTRHHDNIILNSEVRLNHFYHKSYNGKLPGGQIMNIALLFSSRLSKNFPCEQKILKDFWEYVINFILAAHTGITLMYYIVHATFTRTIRANEISRIHIRHT